MARSAGRLHTNIWAEPAFRSLTASSQRLYMLLLSQPKLDNVGVLPLQVSKWAKYCDETTEDDIRNSLIELSKSHFVYFDDDTEEALIRSFIYTDGVIKQPNILKNAYRCALAIESSDLRLAIAREFRSLGKAEANKVADELNEPV